MTPTELRRLRAALGVTGAELARALEVTDRTVRGWEAGVGRRGEPNPIPRAVAVLLRLALKSPSVRRELGISSRAHGERHRQGAAAAEG